MYASSNLVFNSLLTNNANATRFSTLTSQVEISDYAGFNQINISVWTTSLNHLFVEDGPFRFDFLTDPDTLTDLSALTSHVINSSDGTNYYTTSNYSFTSLRDSNSTIQPISTVNSTTSGSNAWIGVAYDSNSNLIANLATLSDYHYAEVTASGFYDILNSANDGGGITYGSALSNFHEQLLSTQKWDADNLRMDLSDGDKISFGVVFTISQQVNNTLPGYIPDFTNNFVFLFGGSTYTIPAIDICSATLTTCYAINFIATALWP